jgi:hypothetical protein
MALGNIISPFIWGEGGAQLTPEQIAQQRKVLQALMGKTDTSPVGHWTQGAARIADAIGDVIQDKRLDAAEKENTTYNTDIINSLLGGASAAPAASAMPATTGAGAELAATSPASGMDAYRNAIASIESAGSGDYSAVGPTNPNLGRALGRYQIMEANIGPWSQEALGRAVTADEFLANPQLQDAIFDKKFGSYVEQFGPEGAAQAWFAGPGGVGKLDRKDALGTSVAAYSQKFNNAVGGAPAAIEAAAPSSGYVDPMVSAPNASPQTAEAPPLPAPVEVAPAPAVAAVPQQQVAQAITPQTPAINPAILRALTDPRATPQTRAVAQALMQQEARKQEALQEQQTWMARQQYEQQQQQNDPLRQLQIRKAQMEIDSANQPKRQPLINAGNGNVYDPNSGEWIQAPGTGQEKLPDSVRALELRAERAGLKPGTPEYNQFMISGGSGGTSLSVGPNGEVNFTQGGAVKPLTEAQSKDAVYATRATNALPLLNKYEDSLLSLSENMADGVPMNLGRYAQSEEYQVARDAGRDFLATILRKDTGAAITQQEEEIYGKMFLPQPGDKPAAIQAKKQRRTLAVEAIKAGMPTNAIENMAKALEVVPASTAVETDGEVPPAPDGIDPNDWKFMTPAERKLFQ